MALIASSNTKNQELYTSISSRMGVSNVILNNT